MPNVTVSALLRWPLGPDFEFETRTLVGVYPAFEVVSRTAHTTATTKHTPIATRRHKGNGEGRTSGVEWI